MTCVELQLLAKAIADPATSDAERDLILSVFAGIYLDAAEEVYQTPPNGIFGQ